MAKFLLFLFVSSVLMKAVISVNIIASNNTGTAEEILVANFLGYLMERYQGKRPLFVVTHDYDADDIPIVFQELFKKINEDFSINVISNFDGMGDVYCPLEKRYWFAYMKHPDLVALDTTIFHVVFFHSTNIDNVIKRAAKTALFLTNRHNFVIWNKDNDFEESLTHKRTDIWAKKIALNSEEPNSLTIRSVCFYCDQGAPEIVTIGKFNAFQPHELDSINLFPEFTRHMNGRFLLGSWINSITPEDIRNMRQRYVPLYICQNLILDVANYLGFNFIVTTFDAPPNDEPAEVELKDGNWSGQSGYIFHEYADFGLCKASGDNMLQVADYSAVPILDKLTLITRKPKPAYSWRALIQPYSTDMWAALFSACFIFSFVFCGLLLIIYKFHNPFPDDQRPSNLLIYSFRYLFSTLMEENPPQVPTSVSARAFLVFWWLFSVVIICGYESKLISFLAEPELEVLPRSFKELATWPKWSWGMSTQHGPYFRVLSGGIHRPYFFENLEKTMLDAGTMEECFLKSVYEDFSCVTIVSWLYMFQYMVVDREGNVPVDVHEEGALYIYLVPVIEKHSLFWIHYSDVISHLWDAGLIDKYTNDYKYSGMVEGLRRGRAQNRLYTYSRALNVSQMSGAFYGVAIGGWLLPLIAFFWDFYKFKKEKAQEKMIKKKLSRRIKSTGGSGI